MKKAKKIFLMFFLTIVANSLSAQFNSVSYQKRIIKISSNNEDSTSVVFNRNVENANNESTLMVEHEKKSSCHKQWKKSGKILFSHPLERGKLIVTSHYGYRSDPITKKRKFHKGIDVKTNTENIYAMMPGRIKKIGYDKKLGNYIRIEHGDWEIIYAHLYTVRGSKGDFIPAGYSVGISGSTGRSTGEHLHITMKYKGEYIDPFPVIQYIIKQIANYHNSNKKT